MHVSELTPKKAERVITFGGTRAGKSSLTDMTMRQVQLERPNAMQVLVDTKPRYRAETERGRFYNSRKPAAERYETWEAGPTVPNSVVVDIWDDKPFKGLFERPGEIAIMQGAEFEDWRRMLQLLKGFVNAQIKGRERRIIVDECLDFTRETLSVLTRAMTCFTALPAQAGNVELELTSAHTECTVCRRSFCKWPRASISFTCAQTQICDTSEKSESKMPRLPKVITCSANIRYDRAEQCQNRSQVSLRFPIGICHNCQTHNPEKEGAL